MRVLFFGLFLSLSYFIRIAFCDPCYFLEYIWWRTDRLIQPHWKQQQNWTDVCRFVLFIWNAEKDFEISVFIRDITHLRSCHYTILTQLRTQIKRISVWFIEWNENSIDFYLSPTKNYVVLTVFFFFIQVDQIYIDRSIKFLFLLKASLRFSRNRKFFIHHIL